MKSYMLLTHATTQSQKCVHSISLFTWYSRKDESMVTEGRSLVAWEDGRVGLTGKGHKKTFWGMKMFSTLIVIVVNRCVNCQNSLKYALKWVNLLYVNDASITLNETKKYKLEFILPFMAYKIPSHTLFSTLWLRSKHEEVRFR